MLETSSFFGFVFVLTFAVKIGLFLVWSAQLANKHSDKGTYFRFFLMMFGSQKREDTDPALWKDLEPIQRKNNYWNAGLAVFFITGFFLLVIIR